MLAGSNRGIGRSNGGASFAQCNLVHVVHEFDRQLNSAQSFFAVIDQLAGKDGDFLVQEVFSAAKREALDLDFRGVCGFRGAEVKMSRAGSPVGRGAAARPKIQSGEDNNDSGCSDKERKSKRTA